MVNGIALSLNDPNKTKFKRKFPVQLPNRGTIATDDELIFNLEDEQVTDLSHSPSYPSQAVSKTCSATIRNQLLTQTGSLKLKSKSPTRPIFRSMRLEKHVLHFS